MLRKQCHPFCRLRGRRLAKTTAAGITYYVYDQAGHLIAELDSTGAPVQEHIWLNDTPLAMAQGTTLYYVDTDQLNTPRALINATGTVVWRWTGEAFGDSPAEEDPDADSVNIAYNLRFAGQYYDRETNTFYNGARDYDPAIGRYLQSDPIGLAGGINTYAYVNGNPLKYVDPSGKFVQIIIGGVIGGMAGLVSGLSDPNATSLSITEAVAVGATVGAASAAAPIGGAFAGAIVRNALAAFSGNSAAQVVVNGTENYNLDQALTQGVVGGLSGGYGNAIGLTTGLSMVRNGATAVDAISASLGIGTTGATGMGIGLNMLLPSRFGGLNSTNYNDNRCSHKQ